MSDDTGRADRRQIHDPTIVTVVCAEQATSPDGVKFLAEHRDRIIRTDPDGSVYMRWRASELRHASS